MDNRQVEEVAEEDGARGKSEAADEGGEVKVKDGREESLVSRVQSRFDQACSSSRTKQVTVSNDLNRLINYHQ
jgi:hypothetical protein